MNFYVTNVLFCIAEESIEESASLDNLSSEEILQQLQTLVEKPPSVS